MNYDYCCCFVTDIYFFVCFYLLLNTVWKRTIINKKKVKIKSRNYSQFNNIIIHYTRSKMTEAKPAQLTICIFFFYNNEYYLIFEGNWKQKVKLISFLFVFDKHTIYMLRWFKWETKKTPKSPVVFVLHFEFESNLYSTLLGLFVRWDTDMFFVRFDSIL
jgi:hypothetical protein